MGCGLQRVRSRAGTQHHKRPGARYPVTGDKTLTSPHKGFILGVPFGPPKCEASKIHDLRQMRIKE